MNLPKSSRFKIKFCGLRRAADIEAANEAGADAIGLNFCPASPRYVTAEIAAELAHVNRGRACLVGVFVNPTIADIRKILENCPLDAIQLHGDELPENFAGYGLPSIIKALPWREANGEDAAMARLWSDRADEVKLVGFLVDAYDPRQRGGTGRVARWDLLAPRPRELAGHRMLLAGGLTPGNVFEAIQVSRPDAVDTASGVESGPGVKDAEKMKEFVNQVRKGFESAK